MTKKFSVDAASTSFARRNEKTLRVTEQRCRGKKFFEEDFSSARKIFLELIR
ncbi:MAG: hypothetical protein IKN27_14060 [Selenomonadaceae bacterium]|nr:hypothetical protein [Selenomonadaceae bacterium]